MPSIVGMSSKTRGMILTWCSIKFWEDFSNLLRDGQLLRLGQCVLKVYGRFHGVLEMVLGYGQSSRRWSAALAWIMGAEWVRPFPGCV